jgi:HAD superfamily hydrolase (TIGR01549 family)
VSAPLIILDIGSTLVSGPPSGPAPRIAEAIGINTIQKRELNRMLMTNDYSSPAEVSAAVHDRLGLTGVTVESAISDVWIAQEKEGELIPGAVQALERFVDLGYQLALLSNIWTAYLRAVRRLLGDFFDAHIPPELQLFSCREGLAKPRPELFDRLLERADALPERTLMIGDSYQADIEPAIRCGMRTLWLLHNPTRERAALISTLNGLTATPTLTLHSLADLDFDSPVLPRASVQHEASAPVLEPQRPVGE